MKILVVQLARFGDVFQTIPVRNALLRQGHEVDILTRQAYSGAAAPWTEIPSLKIFDTKRVLRPLLADTPDIEAALQALSEQLQPLWANGYDRVVNLTFSPFSSWVASSFASRGAEVRGYTRTDDGHLGLTDDPSAYFFGQVGVGSHNRLHVCDLFAQVADIDLQPSDFAVTPLDESLQSETVDRIGQQAILIHPQASDESKTLDWSKWSVLVRSLLATWPGEVVLIGSQDERANIQRLVGISGVRRAVNLAGETSWLELYQMMRRAKLLVGGDSGPIHLASLAGLKTVNISVGPVNFWETGPRANESLVVRCESSADLPIESLARLIQGCAAGQPATCAELEGAVLYQAHAHKEDYSRYVKISAVADSVIANTAWNMIQALYMGGSFPEPGRAAMFEGCQHLFEAHQIAAEQVLILKKSPRSGLPVEILKRVDEVSTAIARFVPELEPVARWYEAEKVRIAPGSVDSILDQHLSLHEKIMQMMRLYIPQDGEADALKTETTDEPSDLES
jgi:ADP-heptose:LPS heptosyltransferase